MIAPALHRSYACLDTKWLNEKKTISPHCAKIVREREWDYLPVVQERGLGKVDTNLEILEDGEVILNDLYSDVADV